MVTSAERTRLGRLRVLVVDDRDMQRIVAPLLQDLGIRDIFRAADGQTALNLMLAQTGFIHLILCDWNVPRKNGLDVLKTVRARWGDIPFIMTTTKVTRPAIEAARKNGVSAYLIKPFTAKDLEQRVIAVVRRHDAGEASAIDENGLPRDSWLI